MDIIDINTIKENDLVRFIAPNKTLFNGVIRKVSNEYLGIAIDTRQDTFIRLNKNQLIELILVEEHKAKKCAAVILGCSQSDFEQVVLISIPKLILGIERRGFERLSIVMDIEYSPLPFESNYKNLNNVESKYFRYFRKTYTVNISAGGVYFIIPKNERDSNFALISLSLKNEKIVTLSEKIRRDYTNDLKHDRVAFKFNDIKARDRQMILDFISEKSKKSNNF